MAMSVPLEYQRNLKGGRAVSWTYLLVLQLAQEQCLNIFLKLSLKWSQRSAKLVVKTQQKKTWNLNNLLFIFKPQVRSQGRKEEEKEEGEHVDDDVDSINGEDE